MTNPEQPVLTPEQEQSQRRASKAALLELFEKARLFLENVCAAADRAGADPRGMANARQAAGDCAEWLHRAAEKL